MNAITEQLMTVVDESKNLQQAIANLCDGDSPVRAVNVEIGFVNLVYQAILSPADQAR